MSEPPAVVLDNGTGFLKVGYAGSSFPTAVIGTHLGRPILRAGAKVTGKQLKDVMIGDETNGATHLLEMSYPVKNGVIQNMDEMLKIWDYAIMKKMEVNPAERGISLSEAAICSHKHRAKIFEVMFEHYGFQKVQSKPQGVLAMTSASLESGIVVDSGEGFTMCMPVFQGYSIPKAVRQVDLGGRDITEQLLRLLQRRGYNFNPSADMETVRAIKEMFCYAAVDFRLETRLATETVVLEKAMTLPDGSQCVIGSERFEATECLFSPGLMQKECDGLSQQLWNSIQACDIDIRSHLYQHVVLSGGSTMFPGLPTRLESDIKGLFLEKALKGDRSRLEKFVLNIEDPPRRKYMVFLGGAVWAELTKDVADEWLTKEEWAEGGASAVNARFAPRQ
jgi:actin-related protein 2